MVRKISAMEGRLLKLLNKQKNDDKLIDELFILTLSQPPAPELRTEIRQKVTAVHIENVILSASFSSSSAPRVWRSWKTVLEEDRMEAVSSLGCLVALRASVLGPQVDSHRRSLESGAVQVATYRAAKRGLACSRCPKMLRCVGPEQVVQLDLRGAVDQTDACNHVYRWSPAANSLAGGDIASPFNMYPPPP